MDIDNLNRLVQQSSGPVMPRMRPPWFTNPWLSMTILGMPPERVLRAPTGLVDTPPELVGPPESETATLEGSDHCTTQEKAARQLKDGEWLYSLSLRRQGGVAKWVEILLKRPLSKFFGKILGG